MMKRFACALPLLCLASFLAQGCASGLDGQWQGSCYPREGKAKPKDSALVVGNTNGSGGSFGKGDNRHNLNDVFMWSPTNIWACGYAGVFRSEDGGVSWSRVLQAAGWYHIQMTGPQEIWLLEGNHPGGPGKVWLRRSSDGGLSWREEIPGKLAGYADFLCRGPERWVLQGSFGAWRSSDGGATWKQPDFALGGFRPYRVAIPADQANAKGDPFALYVLGAQNGRRVLLKSSDGGAKWQALKELPDLQLNQEWRQALFFASSQEGWTACNNGTIHYTSDGGKTWTERSLPVQREINALWFDQLGNGYAALANGDHLNPREALFSTKDGGKTWTLALDGAKNISSFSGRGPGQMIAVGDQPGFVRNDLVVLLKP